MEWIYYGVHISYDYFVMATATTLDYRQMSFKSKAIECAAQALVGPPPKLQVNYVLRLGQTMV